MKAYVPIPHTITSDGTTFILEHVTHYVPTQVELLELSQSAAHFTIATANADNSEQFIISFDQLLGRIPVYGTKCDCENACKVLNKGVKEKALATIQLLSKL